MSDNDTPTRGRGRPALPPEKRRSRSTVTLPGEVWSWLRGHGNASAAVEDAVRAAMGREQLRPDLAASTAGLAAALSRTADALALLDGAGDLQAIRARSRELDEDDVRHEYTVLAAAAVELAEWAADHALATTPPAGGPDRDRLRRAAALIRDKLGQNG